MEDNEGMTIKGTEFWVIPSGIERWFDKKSLQIKTAH